MDSPTAFCSNLSSFFPLFVYAQLILLLIVLLCYRSVVLFRLKSFLDFFLPFFQPNHQNIQATIVIEEHQNQELFGLIHAYITCKLLPCAGGVVNIAEPRHSNTLTWRVDPDQEIPDSFRGVPLKWILRVRRRNGIIGRFRKTRNFELYVPQKHLTKVSSLYLQSHVPEEAVMILSRRRRQERQQQPWRNDARVGWVPVIAGPVIQLISVMAGLLMQLIGCC